MGFLRIILTAVLVLLAYCVFVGVYRVCFSPVAGIPGPLLAKLTYWYEFYWDVIKVGQYTFHIRDLHDQYGPIIRVNPREVHIDDPDFYNDVFVSSSTGRKRERWSYFTKAFGMDDSLFSTLDHDLHRARRAALDPFFSKAKIRALQGRIEHIVTRLLARMLEFRETREPMSIGVAFTAFTYDVASSYALDQQDFLIDVPDFAPNFRRATEELDKATHLMKQFPWILKLIEMVPVSWIAAMDSDLGAYMGMQADLQDKTTEIMTTCHQPDYKPPERTTILHEVLSSSQIPESEKSHARLWQDAEMIIVAGTVTTAPTFSNLFFFLLSDSTKLQRLRTELVAAIPDRDAPVPLTLLENLLYLTACIREALRVSNGVSSRLQRIDPEKSIVFHARKESYGAPAARDTTYVIPSGTPVSMTQLLTNFNPRVYPEPRSFLPERWIEKDPVTGTEHIHHKLDKYYAPFSKGTRACLGVNLAEADLYMLMAMVFRRYGSKACQIPGDDGYLELFDTSYERDVEIIGDGFTPIVREPLKGVKVKVHPCEL